MEVAHREVLLRRREGRADRDPRHHGRGPDLLRGGAVGEGLRHPRPAALGICRAPGEAREDGAEAR